MRPSRLAALVLAATWLLPARAQEAPGPSIGLGALPGDNAPGTAGPRIAGTAALRIAITIETACSVDRDAVLAFPGAATGGAGSIAIDCTNGLPFLLAFDAGSDTIPGHGTGAPVIVPLFARAPPTHGRPAAVHDPVRLTVAY